MRKGGRRSVKVPPNLTYYERNFYPDLSENAILYYEIKLIEIRNTWDSTLHVRTAPFYSESTKKLAKRFNDLTPSTDTESEYQKVQFKVFSQADQEYHIHFDSSNKEGHLGNSE